MDYKEELAHRIEGNLSSIESKTKSVQLAVDLFSGIIMLGGIYLCSTKLWWAGIIAMVVGAFAGIGWASDTSSIINSAKNIDEDFHKILSLKK